MSPDEPEVTELQLGTAKIDKPEAIDFILGQTQVRATIVAARWI
jgi:hypothetical protein